MRVIVLTTALIPALGLLCAAPGALAQFNPTGLPNGGKAQEAKPAPPPPDALPGASVNRDRVTPAERSDAEMDPNDALFDSINRGDISSARDAISRGADLQARNILGMTPLELSVDLSRNDITFLLLSMRGMDDSHGRPPLVATAEAKPGRAGRAGRHGVATVADATPGAAPRQPGVPAGRAPATTPVAERRSPRLAQLYAGNGGAPVPSAGFLGFDSGTAR
jgi:hypothetical protein